MHDSAHLDHARHDLALIAGHAAGELSNLDTAAATALLSTCSTCADVHRDLIAIAAATRALPPTPAPRDFRITAEQAERLRRRSWLRTLVRPFGSARSATRPLATAFTSVGLAGALVAMLIPGLLSGPGLLGGVASGPTSQGSQAGAPASVHGLEAEGRDTVAPGATVAPAVPAAGAPDAASGDPDFIKQAEDSGYEAAAGDGTTVDPDAPGAGDDLNADVGNRLTDGGPVSLLLVGSLGLLAVGVALFGLRLAARRLR
jgi:hypothetical protein